VQTFKAACPSGKAPVGGGYFGLADTANVTSSAPYLEAEKGWVVVVYNHGAFIPSMTVFVMCL
jgi:hypothetical protein